MFSYLFQMLISLFCALTLSAQLNAQPKNPIKKGGTTILHLNPVNQGTSMNELFNGSPLIVDGTILAALPTIVMNSGYQSPLIESHSIINVAAVLKGVFPSEATKLVISQIGGKVDGWDVMVEGDEFLVTGDRYIFFLQPDERKEPSNATGMPRYSVVGVWSGKAKVTAGKFQFSQKTSLALQLYNGADVSALTQEIKDRVSGKFIPAKRPPGAPHPLPSSGPRP